MSRPLYSFPGGLRLATHKEISDNLPSMLQPLPERLILPLHQHIGIPATPVVSVGDRVLKGQVIARPGGYVSVPVHASTSGRILDIGNYPVPHAGEFKAPCIVIEADGKDTWTGIRPIPDFSAIDPFELQAVIREAGIAGLGGAGFPAHVKLGEGMEYAVETLIINGVECEPFITCDDRLIQEKAGYIVAGTRMIGHAVQARHCIIAIEDDMPEAWEALNAVPGDDIERVRVPTRYPAGGEKQLIRVLTGRDVPGGSLPIHMGILMHNVATAAAVYRAVSRGEPVISRYVTITGEVETPRNLQVLLGTPVKDCVEKCGHTRFDDKKIILGGPMMGMQVKHPDLPIVKTTNCVLVRKIESTPPALPCIGCGKCVNVCPARLLPQQLHRQILAEDFDTCLDDHLFDCIECGLCAYVCPSHIPLVQSFRHAKSCLMEDDQRRQAAAAARERYTAHRRRREQQDADQRHDATESDNQSQRRNYIQAAVLRSRKRRRQIQQQDTSRDGDDD